MNRRAEYDLFVSEIVIREAAIGDVDVARQRLAICEDLRLLAVTDEAERLAPLLLKAAAMASNAERRMRYTLRWPRFMGWTICSRGTAATSPMRRFVAQSTSSAERRATSRQSSAHRKN